MKRFALLLEVLIAMMLMSIVVTALLSAYSQMMFMQGEIQSTKKTTFENLYTQFRLGTTLSRAISPGDKEKENEFFFYTRPNSLLFTYNNGTGGGPLFSNSVIGKIAVNTQKQLTLTTWPSAARAKENPPSIREVLMEGVEEIKFSFFHPPILNPKEREKRLNEGKSVEGGWTSEWAIDNQDLPAIIKIAVKREGASQPLLFSTVFGNTLIPVSYP